MNDFKIGQRVRAKHDHMFEGEVRFVYPDVPFVSVKLGHDWICCVPMRWLEPVPKPLNPLVPWDVLDDELRKCYTPRNSDSIKSELRARLRERGYGPAEETR